MKILLVTGTLAAPQLRQIIDENPTAHTFDILELPLAVAAFLHPKYVLSQIKLRGPVEEYNLILLPGMVLGDTSIVTKSIGIPTFKGTRHAADLPLLFDILFDAENQLSTTQAADLVFADKLAKKAQYDLTRADKLLQGKIPEGYLTLGRGDNRLIIGPRLPMRIIAEITDAPLRSEEELLLLARHFATSGAHIIDIGMVAESPDPTAAHDIVKLMRKHLTAFVSIDSMKPEEIEAGLDAGAHLVLSLDQDNMMDIEKKYRNRAIFTVIPAAQQGAEIPKSLEERVELLSDNLSNARSLGYKKLIADPLCDPLITPGLMNALQAYALFGKREPHVPMLMGIGNITELLDADSPGANALLAGLATELGVSLLLTTEVSPKTKGSVWESHRAAQMMHLARRRRAHPKDIGLDLLLLKPKRFPEQPFERDEGVDYPIINVTQEAATIRLDRAGFFTFHVDRKRYLLITRHYTSETRETPSLELEGANAEQLINAILTRKLVTQFDHAAYIGRELTRAELALITGRPYIQEAPLFSK
ncbi:MAG: dihydropteroate synthase-like protein [Promethearchaeota archaeon]